MCVFPAIVVVLFSKNTNQHASNSDNCSGSSNSNIYTFDDFQKVIEKAAENADALWKALAASQKEEIQFQRKFINKYE